MSGPPRRRGKALASFDETDRFHMSAVFARLRPARADATGAHGCHVVTDVDPRTCPLCRRPNGCQLAAGKSKCWCFYEDIPAHVRERIPPELLGERCICLSRATADDRAEPGPSEREAGVG